MNRILLIAALAAVLAGSALIVHYSIRDEGGAETAATQPSAEAPASEAQSATATPEDGAATAPAKPSFDVVRVKPTGEAVIAGRAAPGWTVTLTDNGAPMGEVTADQNGEWVFVPETPLAPGNHELSLTARPPDGGESLISDDLVVVVVPQPQTDIAGQPSAETGEVLAMIVPRDGQGAATLLQVPGGPDSAAPTQGALSLDTVDYDAQGRVIVGGRAEPGAEVRVYIDNGLAARTIAGTDGRWAVTPDDPVPPGLHQLRVDQVDGQGKVTARVESPFEMAPVELATNGTIVVQPGNSLWRIARRSYGEGLLYTVIYQANRDQIRNPDLIYPGQVFLLPAPATN